MSQPENKRTVLEYHSNQWRWNDLKLQWEYLDHKGQYFPEHHPLPRWFIEAGAEISASKFCEIWQSADTLNDVKKELFWCSLEELEEQKEQINAVLRNNSVQILEKLELVVAPILSREEILELLDKDILFREPDGQLEGDEYDPMKALLEAQRKQDRQEARHIQTMEISHKRRFSIRH